MKDWLKRITGIAAREAELEQQIALHNAAAEAERKRLEEADLELIKKISPKEYADRKGEPWVNVLDMQINEENIRNGFFELDWNDLFIQELIKNNYGTEADPQEEIVDRWFRDIIFNMLQEEGLDTQRGSGYINVVPIARGKSEVS
tara:strand:+ start:317 stop:754 length:438 start_codon:yes stop_codon:yes gene_type:complete